MKKLFFLVVIITLPLIAFFQYKNYKRFHPPVSYDFVPGDSVDVNYHDQDMVQQYFKNVYEIGKFAREMWFNESIDVRFPDKDDPMAMNATQYYNTLLSQTTMMDKKLTKSYEWKRMGYNNRQIKELEIKALDPEKIRKNPELLYYQGLRRGDKSLYVWNIQDRLRDKGYTLPRDGVFGIDTFIQLKAFQREKNIFPSGEIDELTFIALFAEPAIADTPDENE